MEKKVIVRDMKDIRNIISAATHWFDSIHVTDSLGDRANAKSILGLLALDYSNPVQIGSDNAEAVKSVYKSLQKQS